jgi:hypothetical protein
MLIMLQTETPDIRKAVKTVKALASEKFGRDWSLVVTGWHDGDWQIEGRHTEGRIVRSVVWHNGRIEHRTSILQKAKG